MKSVTEARWRRVVCPSHLTQQCAAVSSLPRDAAAAPAACTPLSLVCTSPLTLLLRPAPSALTERCFFCFDVARRRT